MFIRSSGYKASYNVCEILNNSLMQDHVPDALKVACITPVLKKPCADTQIMKKFLALYQICLGC